MNNMKLYYILSLFLMSCTKDPMPIPNPCKLPDCSDTITPKPEGLELLWQTKLRTDGEYTTMDAHMVVGDYFVTPYDNIEQEKLLFIHKGDTSTSRFYGPNKGGYLNYFYHPEVGLIVTDYIQVFTGKDAASMRLICSVPVSRQFESGGNLVGDYLYIPARDDEKGENYIYKINIYSGNLTYDKIVRYADYPQYQKILIDGPSYFVTNEGDTLLTYGYTYLIDFMNARHKGEVIRKSDGKVLFTDSITYKFSPYQHDLLNYQGKMIVIGSSFIYCIDPSDWSVKWSTPYISSRRYPGWLMSNSYILDNRICFLDQGHYVEIDAETGAILYDSPELFGEQSDSRITYFDGIFYWTAEHKGYSKIFGLRAGDHKLVLLMKSPNTGKPPYYTDTNYHTDGVVIDPATRLLYTADGFFAQCFKIPEKWE